MDLSNINSSSPLSCAGDDVGGNGDVLNTVLQTSIIKLWSPSTAAFSSSTFDYDSCILCIGVASALYSLLWVS